MSGLVRVDGTNATENNGMLPAAEIPPRPKHVAGSLQTQMGSLPRRGRTRKQSEDEKQKAQVELARITNSGEPAALI